MLGYGLNPVNIYFLSKICSNNNVQIIILGYGFNPVNIHLLSSHNNFGD